MMERKTRLLLAVPFTAGLLFAGQTAWASAVPEPVPVQADQQTISVRGNVSDNTGETLMGVTVMQADNTRNVAVTDLDGNFTIRVPRGAVLKFTYVGYKSVSMMVDGNRMDVTMEADTKMLDDVVVVGYGTVRKADLAGAVSVLKGEAFQDQPITQVSDALQGRVAGVNVISDGLPGSSAKIRVRGSNSINKSNEPLYVVDGMVRESGLDGISPDDIQSMQILKDASSTAIYGSRGANGVVIITTKQGRRGQTGVTFDASFGWSNATRLPEVMNAQDYAKNIVQYGGIQRELVEDYINGTNPGVDYIDMMFRTGFVQNYKVALTKGSESTRLYVSGNYMNHKGILEGSQYERYQARVNVDSDIYSWLKLTADVNFSHGEGKGVGGIALGGYNPLYLGFNYSPSMELKNADGVYNYDPYCSINENPIGVLHAPNQRNRDILNARVDLRFNIVKGLTFTTSNGFDYYNGYGYGQTLSTSRPNATTGALNSNNNRWFLQTTNNLTYDGTFNEKHNLTATAVWEATKSVAKNLTGTATDLGYEGVGWWDLGNGAQRNATNSYTKWTLLSGVARVIYNFDNRYLLTGTFRADGSSILSEDKWSYFPSIAAAWTISNESFMESINPTISELKLRASYGLIGNQDVTPYATQALMSPVTVYYGGKTPTTGYQAGTSSKSLKWETTRQFDLGVDASFLNGRITVNLDYFYKYTKDALLQTTLPGYLGGFSYWLNGSEVSNTGFDVAINASVIESGDWNWSTALTGSFVKNKVKKMTTNEPILYAGSMQSIVDDYSVIMEGEPIGSLYGFKWAGIDSEGYDTYFDKDGNVTRDPTSEDRTILGHANPNFLLGWNNTITWKNWSLNAFFNGAFGAKRMNVLRYAMCNPISNSRQITSPDGITGIGVDMPSPSAVGNKSIGASSHWVENADYFRLENITLAYNLRKQVTKFADIRLSFGVQNLFTITGYKGMNPSTFTFADSGNLPAWQQGIDMGTTPCPRTFTVGARFTF